MGGRWIRGRGRVCRNRTRAGKKNVMVWLENGKYGEIWVLLYNSDCNEI